MIILRNSGPYLTTRALGKKIREMIEKELDGSAQVLVNFAGVEMASHSFCDEAFGKLLVKMGLKVFKQKIKFSHCNPEVEAAIKFALRTRLNEEKLCAMC